jgi:NADH:ubiquinone oxidoreductase subunit 5 (subunit L)/multisubunit Na+/H+ antiporter MnhA subunit
MVLSLILSLHAVLALAAGLAGRRLGRGVLWLTAIGPAAALAYAVALTVGDGDVVTASGTWAPGLGLDLDLRLDGFGLLFWWLIAGIGLLVMLYGLRYFDERDDLGRFASMLVLFAGAMLLLTASDNVFVLFVAWELTSITSYLLIGFQDDQVPARSSALQALLVTGSGGLALLGGLVLLGQEAGTWSLFDILAAPPTTATAGAGLVLVLLGAMTKSAQVPFHFWLPGAMAAPTPVSAYLHSATMVKAGIYILARMAPAFAPVFGWWQPTLLTIGIVTLLLGGYRAMQATDLKALLAYGTVSQLGFIVLLVGAGDTDLTHAGVALILAHALFKAPLFLTVGVVDHAAHTRDLRRLDGVGASMPITAWSAGIAAASSTWTIRAPAGGVSPGARRTAAASGRQRARGAIQRPVGPGASPRCQVSAMPGTSAIRARASITVVPATGTGRKRRVTPHPWPARSGRRARRPRRLRRSAAPRTTRPGRRSRPCRPRAHRGRPRSRRRAPRARGRRSARRGGRPSARAWRAGRSKGPAGRRPAPRAA